MTQFSYESSKIKASLLTILLALAGCTVGPDYERPEVAVAPKWKTKADPRITEQAATDSQWWKSLNDPVLDRLVDMAYQQNLSLQVAGLRIMEARARLGVATGSQYPQIQAAFGSAMAVGLSKNSPTSAGLSDDRFGDYQAGFDAVWEIDFWGKYRRGVESETAIALALVADYYYSIVAVSAEVARTYTAVRTFEVLILRAQENEKIQQESLQIANSRLRHGATSELDVAQATILLESTRASIPQLQIGLEQARNALSTLLGQPPGAVEGLLQGPQEIPRVPTSVAVGVPAEMLRRRPDIRAAELAAAAQCARIGVAEADLYPSFSLFGTIGLQASSGAGITVTAAKAPFFTIGPQISWTFLDYGRTRNSIRVEDARFQQLLVGYRETVLKAAQEVEDSLAGFVYSQAATASVQQAVKAAERAVQISVTQYREGSVDYQRVLDAQRSLLEQQNSLAQTSSSVITNLVGVYKALGGGWESYQTQNYIPIATQDEMKKRTNWGDVLSDQTERESAQSPPVQPVQTEQPQKPVQPVQ